eukprot:1077662-Rhodomonas_salina.1
MRRVDRTARSPEISGPAGSWATVDDVRPGHRIADENADTWNAHPGVPAHTRSVLRRACRVHSNIAECTGEKRPFNRSVNQPIACDAQPSRRVEQTPARRGNPYLSTGQRIAKA